MKLLPAFALSLLIFSTTSLHASWPAWRGDLAGSGATAETDLPVEWSEEKNVVWRVELPDTGNATPVVHGDKVFVPQAIKDENWRGLMCFDRKDGALLWKQGVTYADKERTHRGNPYCSGSAATDGEIVVASYGSAGMVAYDLDGKELWRRDLGAIDHTWGNASSPLIYGDLVIHYHGPGTGAHLLALDKKSGETAWKWEEPKWKPGKRTDGVGDREGEGVIGSFSTPIIVEAGDRDELVMSFPMELKGFDPETGKKLWTASGLNPLVYTSPVVGDDIVVAMGGYRGNSVGVKTGGDGDVTESHRLWHEVRHNGGIGSGVVNDGHLFYQDSGGIVNCLDLKTGEMKWEARLPGAGKSWGSFLLSGDRIYTLSQAGDTVVFKANPEEFEVIGQGDVGEHTNASLAPSDGQFFVRTWEALWCIGKE